MGRICIHSKISSYYETVEDSVANLPLLKELDDHEKSLTEKCILSRSLLNTTLTLTRRLQFNPRLDLLTCKVFYRVCRDHIGFFVPRRRGYLVSHSS